ncbi:MAG TPA: DUF2141 domain-containing protein [Rhodocyclaceae bacterium]|nr:DUF2141 domain-containing protein [Rhodocyclaceae bacterium]
MRKLIPLIAAAAFSGAAFAADLTVTVENVASATGNVRLALYQGAENFLVTPAQRESLPAAPGKVPFIFRDLPPGRYAATAFHDVNDNKKLETDQFGRPLEPTGFSRDAKATSAPPRFDDAVFEVDAKGTQISFRLRPGAQP